MSFTSNLSSQRLYNITRVCAALPIVKNDVLKNHDDNLWWPLNVRDWRLRFIAAGWSTRVSYNMISTYQKVISRINTLGYDRLCRLSDEELGALVASLGLVHSRVEYFKAVKDFIERSGLEHKELLERDNDTLIEEFAVNVKGAGYKVAQCAILYAKGYHCGIFPVDSGMKDMLGPCLGLVLPKGPIAHEIMRKQVEGLLNLRPLDYYELAYELGYDRLAIPKEGAPVWWVHLTLIYFKRRYCNTHMPYQCPLRSDPMTREGMGTMCDRQYPKRGGGDE